MNAPVWKVIAPLPLLCLACVVSKSTAQGLSNQLAAEVTLASAKHHLRSGTAREWAKFPETSEGPVWSMTFSAEENREPHTLLIRQSDVRLAWKVLLNGKQIGQLQPDENELLSHWIIPAKALHNGENSLSIQGPGEGSDDILVGPVRWITTSPENWLNQAQVEIEIVQAADETPLPCRLTILNDQGCLVPVGAQSGNQLAVRTGVIYAGHGKAKFGLPAGNYQIFAGRGFEFSRAAEAIQVAVGDHLQTRLKLTRQVDTSGWVACDTHIHTVTHSGHGDATLPERIITLAGEGIELPVATDHNQQVDYDSVARQLALRDYFTPVIGNEVTTRFGHFNAFPFRADTAIPNFREEDWSVLLPAIFNAPDVQVVILNHARDRHSGYRPLGPENFNEATGESLEGRVFGFNAMETLNSGAQQTDPMELFRDWMALTNRGYRITPIGSSDSHDVNRYLVGQGRTYVRCDDMAPGAIDLKTACQAIRAGRVVVSAGMFLEASVNQQFGPGDLVPDPQASALSLAYEVRCPEWIEASRVQLYQNGVLVRDQALKESADRSGTWRLQTPEHDVFLTVLASGPGTRHPSWPMAQPYQPDTLDWTATNLAFTGAIRIDGDGDGKFSSTFDYAQQIVAKANGSLWNLLNGLETYDEAVAIQAASLWHTNYGSLLDANVQEQWQAASPHIQAGFFRYLSAWRKCQQARVE